MREAIAAVPDTVREQPFGALAVTAAVALCVVVAGVGAIAVWAEFEHSWRSFFVMEQVMAMAAPVTKLLLAAVLLTGLGTVAMAR